MQVKYRVRVERASASLKWIAGSVLPALPVPGTPEFGPLMSALRRFGLDPQQVTLVTPTSRLSDVLFSVGVRNGEIRLQYTYSGLELVAEVLLEEHLQIIPELARVAHQHLHSDGLEGVSRYEIHYMAHLNLESGFSGDILKSYLSASGLENLAPDAFAYRIAPKAGSAMMESRVVLAQSALLPNGVWTDFTLSYGGQMEIGLVAAQARTEILAVLSGLGIEVVEK